MSNQASYTYAASENPALEAPPAAEAPSEPVVPAGTRAHRLAAWTFRLRIRMPGQTGVKLAVVASFLVLVGVMIFNKVRHRDAAPVEPLVAEAPPAAPVVPPAPALPSKSRREPKPHHLAMPAHPAAPLDDDAPPAEPKRIKVADRVDSSAADSPDEPPPADERPAEKVQAIVATADDPPPADEPTAALASTTPLPKVGEEVAPPSPPADPVETPPRQPPVQVATDSPSDLPDLGVKTDLAATEADAPPPKTQVADAQAEPPATTKPEAISAGSMPPFDPPPAGTDDALRPAATEGPKEWFRLPNAAKRHKAPSDTVVDLQAVTEPARPTPKASAAPALTPTPTPTTDPQAEVVTHLVRPGEDFGTIARYYYDSPRFRRALWAANRKRVPAIDDLRPGTTIRVPMPEALDPALIPAPGEATAAELDTPPANKPKSPPERDGLARRPPRAKPLLVPMSEEPARRPSYTVHQGDTLRSIARDTLNDPHRDGEILELNREAIGDSRIKLPQGLRLALPDDALIGRRVR